MKNLRKVLALVLVVASLMGMAVMTNAAYADEAKISADAKEAVALLTALNIVEGTGDNFEPTGKVTRGQMAAMIYRVIHKGDKDASRYASSCTFADVKDEWVKGYVAYMAKAGYISGRTNGNFDHKDNVTGVEAAKMLLGVLGYNAQNEGFQNNASWSANIIECAEEKGLFNGTAALATPDVQLTRQDAARMILNALEATMVKYSQPGSSITINDVTFVTGAGAAEDAPNTATVEKYNEDDKLQLIEKYFPDWRKDESYQNSYGQPGVKWMGKLAEDIVEVIDTPAIVCKGTTTNTKAVYNLTGYTGKELTTVPTGGEAMAKVYCEGLLKTTSSSSSTGNQGAYALYRLEQSDEATDSLSFGKAGMTTEVYWNAEYEELNVVINTDRLGVISAVDEDAETITVAQFDFSQTNYVGTEIGTFSFTDEEYTDDDLYAIVGYAKGSNDGTTTCVAEVWDIDSKTVISKGGVATSAGVYTTYYTDQGDFGSGYATPGTSFTVGEEYVIYFSRLGKVLYAVPAEPKVSTDLVYVLDVAEEKATFGDTTYLAQVLFADGVTEVVETASKATKDVLYTYSINKGVYTLTVADDTADTTVAITTGTAVIGTKYATNSTLFVVETTEDGESVYTTYTGIKNVPSLTVANMFAVTDKEDADKLTVVYCMGATETGVGSSTALDISVLYVPTGLSVYTKLDAAGETYTYHSVKAIINGSVTTVKMSETLYASLKGTSNNVAAVKLIKGYKLDANGVVYAVEAYNTNLSAFTAVTAKWNDGVITLTVGGSNVKTFIEAGTKVYAYDQTSSAMKITNVEALKASSSKTFAGWMLTDADGNVTAIYGTGKI